MRTIVLLLFLAAAGTARVNDYLDMQHRVVNFEQAHYSFVRALFGCTAAVTDPIDTEHCDVRQGRIDYANFEKARKAAMVLYDLKDARDK